MINTAHILCSYWNPRTPNLTHHYIQPINYSSWYHFVKPKERKSNSSILFFYFWHKIYSLLRKQNDGGGGRWLRGSWEYSSGLALCRVSINELTVLIRWVMVGSFRIYDPKIQRRVHETEIPCEQLGPRETFWRYSMGFVAGNQKNNTKQNHFIGFHNVVSRFLTWSRPPFLYDPKRIGSIWNGKHLSL